MNNVFYSDLLQLFAEGVGSGDTPAAEGTTGEENTSTGNPQSSASSLRGTPSDGNPQSSASSLRGTPSDGNPQSSASSLRGTPSAVAGQINIEGDFAKLIGKGGKYEAAYQKQMQKAFNKRFASFKETESKAQRLDNFRKTVAKRYSNVNADDIDALEKAFVSDPRYAEKRAPRSGEKNDVLRAIAARQTSERQRAQAKALADGFYERINAEEKELRSKYKDFDLDAELKDPRFRKFLLDPAHTVEDAYWFIHREDLMKKAIEDARNATVESIASKGTRAKEGASSASVPSTSKVDYANMSENEFIEMYNRMFRR